MVRILLPLFCLVSICLLGQDYVVLAKGDTVRGSLTFMMHGKVEQVTVKGQKRETFSSMQVRHISRRGVALKPVQYADMVRFMEIMQDGYLSLLGFQLPNQSTYEGRLLQRRDGKAMEVPTLGFKKQMANFLSDAPELAAKIREGTYGGSDLLEIITAYNQFIDSKSKTVAAQARSEQVQKSKTEVLDEVIGRVQQLELTNKADILDMLQDVKEKAAQAKPVPSYLARLIKENLAGNEALLEKLKPILP